MGGDCGVYFARSFLHAVYFWFKNFLILGRKGLQSKLRGQYRVLGDCNDYAADVQADIVQSSYPTYVPPIHYGLEPYRLKSTTNRLIDNTGVSAWHFAPMAYVANDGHGVHSQVASNNLGLWRMMPNLTQQSAKDHAEQATHRVLNSFDQGQYLCP